MELWEKIYNAGVVGAGGGGFPTHIKAKSKVEYFLANGAECEPLLHKDYELMINYPGEIVEGMKLMIESVSAKKGFFGIKRKNHRAIEAISPFLKNSKILISELGDFYPSGDEYELVYSATGKLIPPAGIPLNVGCVVNNVETLFNVYKANLGIPATEKFLCITGAVRKPISLFTPIGTKFKDLIEYAGGSNEKEFGVFVGGVMMGTLTFDLSETVTKTTAGLIILPKKHYLIQRKNQHERNWHRIGKSACDQCSYCTELCPRYLLGYNVQPHKVMRSLGFTASGNEILNQYADLCCACGLCTFYSCPEDLYPKEACDKSKSEMKRAGIKHTWQVEPSVHPMKESRRVPIKQLLRKLDMDKYESPAPFMAKELNPSEVIIPLSQNIGEKARSVVKMNSFVKKGDLIAEAPDGKLGANVHASIDGEIAEIQEDVIRIRRR